MRPETKPRTLPPAGGLGSQVTACGEIPKKALDLAAPKSERCGPPACAYSRHASSGRKPLVLNATAACPVKTGMGPDHRLWQRGPEPVPGYQRPSRVCCCRCRVSRFDRDNDQASWQGRSHAAERPSCSGYLAPRELPDDLARIASIQDHR